MYGQKIVYKIENFIENDRYKNIQSVYNRTD